METGVQIVGKNKKRISVCHFPHFDGLWASANHRALSDTPKRIREAEPLHLKRLYPMNTVSPTSELTTSQSYKVQLAQGTSIPSDLQSQVLRSSS